MIAPFFILFAVFVLIPIFVNIVFSFTNFNMRTMEFIGLKNYLRMMKDPLFFTALKNTAVYSVFNVLFTMVISFFLAVLLNRKSRLINYARTIMFMPYVTSMVAVSMIWLWLYEPVGGVFNQILQSLGFQPVQWLLQRKTAMPSIIVMSVWKGVGYNMVLFLAAIQGVPAALYEAAAIDGATSWQKIVKITIPMIRPILFFVFVTNLISSFNVFESVNVMTNGGPMNATTTLVHQIYTRSFTEYQAGYGSAIAIVLSLIIVALTGITFRSGSQGQDLSV